MDGSKKPMKTKNKNYNAVLQRKDKKVFLDPQYSALFRFFIHRFVNNRDVKVLITASGNSTGMGKSTLALLLARTLHRMLREKTGNKQWKAETHTYIDAWNYMDYYQNEAEQGDCVIADEIQMMMDSREFQTKRQRELSQMWQKLRYKNVFTFGTLPGLHRVDLRVREDSDIWINIVAPGRANVYYMTTNDLTGKQEFKRLKYRGEPESLLWLPVDKDKDPDMKYLHQLKKRENVNTSRSAEENQLRENDIKEYRSKTAERVLGFLKENDLMDEFTQAELAELFPKKPDGTGSISQQWISHIKKNVE